MSFSKARIQRFNEVESEVPAPGAYNPVFDKKIKGAVLEKSERFHDGKSLASDDCSLYQTALSVSSRASSTCKIPTFRTPQVPKQKGTKKITIMSCPKVIKSSTVTSSTDSVTKYDWKTELADLKVELLNKNKTIQEYEKHNEEIREEIRKLEKQLEDCTNKQSAVEEQHKKELEQMLKHQKKVLAEQDEKHRLELDSLNLKLQEVLECKERIEENKQEELNDLQAMMEMRLDVKNSELEEARSFYLQLIQDHSQETESLNGFYHDKILELERIVDETKQEHLEELNKMQTRLDESVSKHEEVQNLYLQAVKNHSEETDALKKLYSDKISQLERISEETRQKHVEELDKMQMRLDAIRSELEETKNLYVQDVKNSLDEIENLKKLHCSRISQLERIAEETQQKHLEELDKVRTAADKKVAKAEEDAEKRVKHAEIVCRETMAACCSETDERISRTIAETDAKVKQMEANIEIMVNEAKSAVVDQMHLEQKRCEARLQRMQADREILEHKLEEKETELSNLTTSLDRLKNCAETQESSNYSLQLELDRAEGELAEKKEELRTLKDQIRSEAAEMVGKRKRFEVVMCENQATVTALSARLTNSDAEVERLQRQLEQGEAGLLEHRNLLSAMRDNSKLVHEQIQSLLQKLDDKKGLIDQLEAENIARFNSIKAAFETKIEDLKELAAKEVARLQDDNIKKEKQNAELKQHLDEMMEQLTESQRLLLCLEEQKEVNEIDYAKHELVVNKSKQLELSLAEANNENMELTKKLEAMEDRKLYYKEFCIKIDSILKKERATHAEDKARKDQLEAELRKELEDEKTKRESAEEEVRRLSENCERLKEECEEISCKYSEILGHHNPRQRIKHISKLKDEILRLKQDLEAKSNTISHQQRTIEKLRLEDKLHSLSKGKENQKMSKSTQLTPVPSPQKPLTPLGPRND